VIDAVAVAAEACGFATLWAGEHVVMVDRPESRYPYAHDGQIAVLEGLCRDAGRDIRELQLAVALEEGQPGDPTALGDIGVSELELVEAPPEDPRAAEDWAAALAERWSVALR
jgi:hypothetical protein